MFIVLIFLIASTSGFTVAQKCTTALPYRTSNINHAEYEAWFGKLGENIHGTSYTFGHVFSRHVAINNQCTAQQKSDKKTVFWDELEFYKALNFDNTNCTLSSTTAFNFNQNRVIASPTDYIRGIDCITGKEQLFKTYFVEYKRAIKKSNPTQEEYMASNYVSVWTFYPSR